MTYYVKQSFKCIAHNNNKNNNNSLFVLFKRTGVHEQKYIQAVQIYLQIPTHRLPDLKHTRPPKFIIEKSRAYNPTQYSLCRNKKKSK